MTSFDSASQRLEKSLDRLESAVAARIARVEASVGEGREEAARHRQAAEKSQADARAAGEAAGAAEKRAAGLADANREVGRRLDDTIARITRLLEA